MAFAECMYVGSEAEAIAEKYGTLFRITENQDLDPASENFCAGSY